MNQHSDSIVTIINGARLNVGKSLVGFINPVLYKILGFCTISQVVGIRAVGRPVLQIVKVLISVTKLGTPNFPKMLKLWLLFP